PGVRELAVLDPPRVDAPGQRAAERLDDGLRVVRGRETGQVVREPWAAQRIEELELRIAQSTDADRHLSLSSCTDSAHAVRAGLNCSQLLTTICASVTASYAAVRPCTSARSPAGSAAR